MLVDEGHAAVDTSQGDVGLGQVHHVRLQVNVHFLRRAVESDVNIFTWTTEKKHQLTEETPSTLFKTQHNVTPSSLEDVSTFVILILKDFPFEECQMSLFVGLGLCLSLSCRGRCGGTCRQAHLRPPIGLHTAPCRTKSDTTQNPNLWLESVLKP